MKKNLIIALLVMALFLSACSGKKESLGDTEVVVTDELVKVVEVMAEKNPAKLKPSETVSAEDPETKQEDDTETNRAEEVREFQISEIILIDDNDMVMKITGMQDIQTWGFKVDIYIENKTTDKTLVFEIVEGAINDVICRTSFSEDLEPGKKKNATINFTTTDLTENGIKKFTDVQILLSAYEKGKRSDGYFVYDTVHIYPYGEAEASTFIREPQEGDQVIVDNEYLRITVIGYDPNFKWGYGVNFYIENKTDLEVGFYTLDESLNDFMINGVFFNNMLPRTSSFTTMYWSTSKLEEQSIIDVEKIEFTIRGYDKNDIKVTLIEEKFILEP